MTNNFWDTYTKLNNLYESKEDQEKFLKWAGEDLTNKFYKIKDRLKGQEKDIYYWMKKTPQDLENKINSLLQIRTRKQKDDNAKEGAELLYSDDTWNVYHITTFEASKKYGAHTKWCITGKESGWIKDENENVHWKNYTERGIKFYFYINKKENKKYALALYPKGKYEIFNEQDKSIKGIVDAPKVEGLPNISVIEFEVKDGILVKYNDNRRKVIIPKDVISIGESAFKDCSNLTSINIPDSVTSIESWAFAGCSNLTSIDIPSSVTSIGKYTFYSCNNLKSIVIPNSVTSIGEWAFEDCSNLTNVFYKGTQEQWNNINIKNDYGDNYYLLNAKIHFNQNKNLKESKEDQKKFLNWAGNDLANKFYKIKDRLDSQEKDIYYWLKKSPKELEDRINSLLQTKTRKQKDNNAKEGAELIYSDNTWQVYKINTFDAAKKYGANTKWCITGKESGWVKDGDENQFWKAYIKQGVKFYFYINKKENKKYALAITQSGAIQIFDEIDRQLGGIPEAPYIYGLPKISVKEFEVKDGILYQYNGDASDLIIPENYNGLEITAIGYRTFDEYTNLTSIVMPDNIKSIGNDAFRFCTNLKDIKIPEGVYYIGNGAFSSCTSLTEIKLPEGITAINERTFAGCTNLNSINLSENISYISYGAFSDCIRLTSVTMSDSVTSIDEFAFKGCKNLTDINLSNNINTISNYMFFNCKNLANIIIPKSVTYIGEAAFSYCTKLTDIIIPDGVTSIGKSAFSGCSGLRSITIPSSVKEIGNLAFYGCTRLLKINFKGTEEQWKAIDIGNDNSWLINTTINYNVR